MDNRFKDVSTETEENVVAGLVGAFLFSLAGGLAWYLLNLIGIVASLSGVIGTVCAIKGYELFAKKSSVKGIVISAIIAFIVLVIAWYLCFASDIYEAFQIWFENGEVDFEPTFSECVSYVPAYLFDAEIGPGYILNLFLGLVFAVIGAVNPIKNAIRNAKASGNGEELPSQNFAGAEYFAPTQTPENRYGNPYAEAPYAETQVREQTPADEESKKSGDGGNITPPPYDPGN